MKEIIAVKSNPVFFEDDTNKDFALNANLELVITHSDGKEYHVTSNERVKAVPKIVETRLFVNPEMLQQLITELQLHQQKLDVARKNAEAINSLLKAVKNQ